MAHRKVSEERFAQFHQAATSYFNWDTILRDLNITQVADKGDQYEIACPLHEDWSPSMRLTKSNGVYHCFSCGAKGAYVKFLWETGGRQLPYVEFCEQVLKAQPALQMELYFSSLFIDEKTLDPGFNQRRVFNPKTHTGSELPITTLVQKVRACEDSWDNLVLSLTMLQQGLTTDAVLVTVEKQHIKVASKPSERISLMDLI